MSESRDAKDPRDLLRAMNKEARAEFEGAEMTDTGGQEHASRSDREGAPEGQHEREGAGRVARPAPGRDDSEAPRGPDGGEVARGTNRGSGGRGDRT